MSGTVEDLEQMMAEPDRTPALEERDFDVDAIHDEVWVWEEDDA